MSFKEVLSEARASEVFFQVGGIVDFSRGG